MPISVEIAGNGFDLITLAAATVAKPAREGDVPGNWFDGVTVILLIVGLLRGRKRGMSEELLSLLQWLSIIVLGSLYCQPLGKKFADATATTLTYAQVFVYAAMLCAVLLLFAMIKKIVGGKLVSSDLFGRLEFYLGIAAGMVRYFCILLAAMAMLNAASYTEEDVQKGRQWQEKELGSVFFPPFAQLQRDITRKSYTSHVVKRQLSTVLIKPSDYTPPPPPRERLRDRKQKELEGK